MKISILALTVGGKKLGSKIAQQLDSAELDLGEEGVADKLQKHWQKCEAIICIMASGIVVRSLAPLLRDKRSDPAIIVLDERGRHVISLLSGHLGGANVLAQKVAAITGGSAVITTASDVLGHTALDLWARANNLVVESHRALTKAAASLVNNGFLHVYSELKLENLPHDLRLTQQWQIADIIISHRVREGYDGLWLVPKILVLGSGCNRGTPLSDYETALQELCSDLKISCKAIFKICSIDKKSDEVALLQLAQIHGWQSSFYSKEQINQYSYLQHSAAAMKAVGAIGVAEPSALLGANQTRLYSEKRKWKNITMALAQEHSTLSVPAPVE